MKLSELAEQIKAANINGLSIEPVEEKKEKSSAGYLIINIRLPTAQADPVRNPIIPALLYHNFTLIDNYAYKENTSYYHFKNTQLDEIILHLSIAENDEVQIKNPDQFILTLQYIVCNSSTFTSKLKRHQEQILQRLNFSNELREKEFALADSIFTIWHPNPEQPEKNFIYSVITVIVPIVGCIIAGAIIGGA